MAGPEDPGQDRKVKDLIDAGTRGDLERWFGLPSFEQLADQGVAPPPPEHDPKEAERLKRRAEILAAADPAFVEAHRRRTTMLPGLVQFTATIEPRVVDDPLLFDESMLARQLFIAEPREYELPDDLPDDLRNATPQALLRDLHRPELDFDKTFELHDPVAELRVDAVAAVAEALAFRGTMPDTGARHREARALLLEIRELRRRPWTELTVKMPNRRVTE
jgi:hypothetical protein